MKRLFVYILLAALLSPLSANAATYLLDPAHSTVGFKVKHLMISNVKGGFEKFKGSVEVDESDFTKSKVKVSVDMASINTGISKRDEHLRSGDFFDVARYPVMTFESTKVELAGADRLKVTGNLTLRGVTKQIVLNVEGPTAEVKSPQGVAKRGVSAASAVNRQDFGVSWNKKLDSGGVLVGDEVQISIEAEFDKQ